VTAVKRIALPAAAVALLLSSSVPAHSTVGFVRSVADSIFTGSSLPQDARVADIDGSVLLDLVVTVNDLIGNDYRVSWYQNDGGGTFSEFVIDTLLVNPLRIAARDVDDDTDVDVVVATEGQIYLYLNNATTFTRQTVDAGVVASRAVRIVDLDGDTDQDIVFQDNSGIYWYENDGAESFTPRTVETVPIVDIGMEIVPFDYDGDLDIVTSVYNADSSYGELVWYENDGSENFIRHLITTHPYDFFGLDVANIDGSGDMDVAVSMTDANEVILYRNDSTLELVETVLDAGFSQAPRELGFFDLDNDTDQDVVVIGGNAGTGEVVYYENNGDLTFTKRTIETLSSNGQTICVADLDGDTRPDIATITTFPHKVVVYNSLGTGTGVEDAIPSARLRLDQNYPNPFNPSTTISYSLPEETFTSLDVFSVRGERVRTLVAGRRSGGTHRARWDGRDDRGHRVATGLYLYRLRAGGAERVRKMILIK
jgi:hypothetical protein